MSDKAAMALGFCNNNNHAGSVQDSGECGHVKGPDCFSWQPYATPAEQLLKDLEG